MTSSPTTSPPTSRRASGATWRPRRSASSLPRTRLARTAGLLTTIGLATVAGIGAAAPVAGAAPPAQTCTSAEARASQQHWFFGARGELDFGAAGSAAPTAAVATSTQVSSEGTTVISDKTGALQFWSDGIVAIDRDGDPMPNGSGLGGNVSATQTVAAFPSMSDLAKYVVVSTSGNEGTPAGGQLSYSVVDMTLNGGKGDVTATKAVPLGAVGAASEGLTAVPNADGSGFWVITFTYGSTDVSAYLFKGEAPADPDGAGPLSAGDAVVSTTSIATPNGGYGSFALSPNRTQLSMTTSGTSAGQPGQHFLFGVDATTGLLTETAAWDGANTLGGNRLYTADFSSSGRYLYASRIFGTGRLLRYDLQAGSSAQIATSVESVGVTGATGGAVRRGPDGRMYVAANGAAALSVVETPDAATAAGVGYAQDGVLLATGSTSRYGLPQMVTGCVPDPVAQIDGPAPDTRVVAGEPLTGGFSCDEAVPGAPAVDGCTATVTPPGGGTPIPLTDGGDLPTGTPGVYTITATVTDVNGRTSTSTRTYTVVAPVAVTITGPVAGTTIVQGDAPSKVDFGCSGGVAPLDCAAKVQLPDGTDVPITDGADLPTAQTGTYTITSTVTDADGRTKLVTRTYAVAAKLAPIGPPAVGGPGLGTIPAPACSAVPLSLTDVTRGKRGVVISGVTDRGDAGRRVAIRYLGSASRPVVGRPVVGTDGRFTVTVKDPDPRNRVAPDRRRYQAELGTKRSLLLKLTRRFTITSVTTASHDRWTVVGRATTPLPTTRPMVEVRVKSSCDGRWRTLANRVRLSRTGRVVVHVPAPRAGEHQVVRLVTTVLGGEDRKGSKPGRTFTVPRSVG
ncbi:hypothetical protein AB0L40_23585 [Patulibacter sp. NPDC049589]|uniref:hypothetical protein n=1 Tax=Patulibacter sp. NPDC049589 TaxID=3154731 RepID=UPI0034430469